jgi:CPA2 family monovalent cation:H+ antiporter-2
VRELRPDVAIVVARRDRTTVEKLYAAGAAEVVPEALESSVMLATHALALSGVPMHKVIKRLREMREQHYALLRGFFPRRHRCRRPPGRCRPAAPACGDADARRLGDRPPRRRHRSGKVGAGVTAIRRRSSAGSSWSPTWN